MSRTSATAYRRPARCDICGRHHPCFRCSITFLATSRAVEQGITPALVVLATRRGIIVLHEAFGRLAPEPDAPALALDTIFPLASISKPVTATAAMLLVEEGRLGLTRPVAEYAPECTGDGSTLRKVSP